jgi:monoamine oxidase
LKLLDNRFETHLLLEGQYFKAQEWGFSQKFEEFWSKKESLWVEYSDAKKRKLDKMDWWRFLSNQDFELRDIMLRELMDSTDFGESIRHTSAYAAFAEYAESSEKNEMDFKIEGGNSQLVKKLSEYIGIESIQLNHQVTSVEQQAKTGVLVQCNNGQSYTGDYLICATPTYSLKKIKWNPALPKTQDDAINALQYARIGKFPIVFSERFWKDENFDLLTDTPAHYFYHGTKNQAGPQGVLMCYAVGEKADTLGSVSLSQREGIIFDALYPAFGNVKSYKKEMLKYFWGTDPSIYGAYAFYGKNQWFEVMPVLKQPFMFSHFAGEHLADWQGFMEGAIQSGFDAVEQIVS